MAATDYVVYWDTSKAQIVALRVYKYTQPKRRRRRKNQNRKKRQENPTCKSTVIKPLDWIGSGYRGGGGGRRGLISDEYLVAICSLFFCCCLGWKDGMLYTCICESRIRFQPVIFSYFFLISPGLPQFRRPSRSGYHFFFPEDIHIG